jgi:hypothetical protein
MRRKSELAYASTFWWRSIAYQRFRNYWAKDEKLHYSPIAS